MVIVVATQNELKLVEEMGYKNETVIITGVGGLNVIRALKHRPKDTHIINIGYVGSNNIPLGTIVEIGDVQTYHQNVDFYEKPKTLSGMTPCYTSTDFVTNTKFRDPCVFDMELAFICAMFDNVKSIKVVSDNLSLEEYEKNVERKDAD